MIRFMMAGSVLAFLGACGDGQMLASDARSVVERFGGETDPDAVDLSPEDLPPGTTNPQDDEGIFRREEETADSGGLVEQISYDPAADTFTVDNIGFDGANVYARDGDVPTLGGYLVFAADEEVEDFLTGNPVGQIVPYRALVGRSSVMVNGEPRTMFAIVRTGGYADYGFGGFVYERNGGVNLPDTGQATFDGDYAGMRVYNGAGGLEYVTGDMVLDIDFDDFNANDAIKGRITNRAIFDDEGNAIAADVRDIANVQWVVVEGLNNLTGAGEIAADVFTRQINPDSGAPENYFEGTFTGIIAGNTLAGDGGEIVGVIRMEAEVAEGLFVQETGGAILSR